jgi:hypothetical protein
VLKGQGNANLVLGYAGSDPALVRACVRVAAVPAAAAAPASCVRSPHHGPHLCAQAGHVLRLRKRLAQHHPAAASAAAGSETAAAAPPAAGAADAQQAAQQAALQALEARVWRPVIPNWDALGE